FENYQQEISLERDKKKKWMNEILEKHLLGFELKFYKTDSERLPYLIYIPNTADLKTSPPLIVFLYGGGGMKTFYDYYSTPEIGTDEPIFKIANELKFVVIYPIQKSSYSWYRSAEPLKDIQNIVKNEVRELNLDQSKIIAGGMSNGGRATFWLAEQDEAIFDAFFTISAEPKLKFDKIDFSKISKPII